MPRMLKMFSMRNEPARKTVMIPPNPEAMGIRLLRRAWRHMADRNDRPLATAVRT